MAAVERSPYADRIEALVDALSPAQQLRAGKELLLCDEEDLGQVLTRWEAGVGGC